MLWRNLCLCRGGRAMWIIIENENFSLSLSLSTSAKRKTFTFPPTFRSDYGCWKIYDRSSVCSSQFWSTANIEMMQKVCWWERRKLCQFSALQIALKFFSPPKTKYLNQFSPLLLLISLLIASAKRGWSERQIIESRCATFCMRFTIGLLLNFPHREVQKLSTAWKPTSKNWNNFKNYAVRNINQFH